jgi:hypothetical protein
MHAETCQWSIDRHARGCAYSFCLFVLCLVSVLEQGEYCASESLAENWCNLQLNAIHSMRRGAGQRKPEGRTQLTISLGFKCLKCRGEFGSRVALDCHRRHINSTGTPCADPENHKSMSFTERGGHSIAGVLREHDTLGVLPVPALYLLKMLFCHTESIAIKGIMYNKW